MEQDYQKTAWKKYFYTQKISERFVVKPNGDQPQVLRAYNRIRSSKELLELELTRTTSLCIKLMEKNISSNDRVIDVGNWFRYFDDSCDLEQKRLFGTDIDPGQ